MMTFKNILKYGVLACIFAIPFIPLVVSDSLFFPYITGKNFLFRFLVELAAGLWLGLAVLDKSYRPKRSWLLGAFVFFVGAITVADLSGVNVYRSLWSNYERMEGLVTILHLFVYFIVLGSVLNEKLWKWVAYTSIGMAIIVGFIGLGQLSQTDRIDATLGNSTYLGGYMLIHIFLVAFFFLNGLYKKQKNSITLTINALIGIFFAYVMYYTGTRGSLLGFLGGFLVMAIILAFKERQQKIVRNISYSFIGLIVVAVLTLGLLRGTPFAKQHQLVDRFSAIVSFNLDALKEYASTQGFARLTLWKMAWEGVKERPVLGWGQDNFNIVFNKYYDPKMYGQEQWFDRTHNVFFDWLIAGGFIGLLSYLSLFIAAMYLLWRRPVFTTSEVAVFTGLIVAYFIHNFFVFDNLISYMLIGFVLAYIYIRSSEKTVLENVRVEEGIALSLSVIALIATPFVIYAVNGSAYVANETLLQALSVVGVQNDQPVSCVEITMQGGNRMCAKAEPTVDVFKRALSYGGPGVPEAREQLLISTANVQQMNISNESKIAYYNFAIGEEVKQIQATPNDARYHFLLAAYLANLNQLDAALSEIQKAVALSPKKQQMLTTEGQILLAKKDIPQAVEVFKQAYELEKENTDAAKKYVNALMAAGNKAEALKVLSESPVILDQSLLPLYYDMHRIDIVESILISSLQKDPSDWESRKSLVLVYLVENKRNEAIALLEATPSNNETNKKLADQYIQQIKAGQNPIKK